MADEAPKFPHSPADFGPSALADTLTDLFEAALASTQIRIDYYSRRGGDFSRYARNLRRTILILFILGTAAPLFGLLAAQLARYKILILGLDLQQAPITEVGYLLLAFAGGFVIYDQLFGTSRSWMRFRQAEVKLQTMATQLRYGWAAILADARGDISRPSVQKRLTALVLVHATAVESLAEAETKEWADQFRAQIESFDQKVQAAQAEAINRAQLAADAVKVAKQAQSDNDDDDEPAPRPAAHPAPPPTVFTPLRWANAADEDEGVL